MGASDWFDIAGYPSCFVSFVFLKVCVRHESFESRVVYFIFVAQHDAVLVMLVVMTMIMMMQSQHSIPPTFLHR